MRMKQSLGASTIAVLTLIAPGYAQSTDPNEAPERQVTLVGCVQKESEYRQMHNKGKGGALGLGGRGDEFVLVNAFEITPGQVLPADTDMSCSAAAGGEAYELEGKMEDHLDAYVGRRVQISGKRNEADIDVATGRPTGGINAVGGDLQLFEVDVLEISEPVLARAPTAEVTRGAAIITETPAPQMSPAEPEPVGTSGMSTGMSTQEPANQQQARADLPATATPLPLAALLGIISLAAAAGLGLTRRS